MEKNPWDVVRLAKNSWGRQSQGMCTLENDEGKIWKKDEDKVRVISRRNFRWDDERTWGEDGTRRFIQDDVKEIEGELREALQGMSNSSAPGPDGISYRFIKAIKDTVLDELLFCQLASYIAKGEIPTEFQLSKVMMIPKPDNT